MPSTGSFPCFLLFPQSHLSPLPNSLLSHFSWTAAPRAAWLGGWGDHKPSHQQFSVFPYAALPAVWLGSLSNPQMRTGPVNDISRATRAASGRLELDPHLQVHSRSQPSFRNAQKHLTTTTEKSIHGLSKRNFRGLPEPTQQGRSKSRRGIQDECRTTPLICPWY